MTSQAYETVSSKDKKELKKLYTVGEHSFGQISIQIPASLIDWSNGYQRSINKRRVNKIIKEFDPFQFQFPTVSIKKNSGYKKFNGLDGHHRTNAATAIHGNDCLITCFVVQVEEDADQFIKMNSNSRVATSNDKFWAAVEKGEETTIFIINYLKRAGIKPKRPEEAKRGDPGICVNLGTVRRLHDEYKEEVFKKAIQCIKLFRLNGKVDGQAFEYNFIHGVFEFCKLNPNIDYSNLAYHSVAKLIAIANKKGLGNGSRFEGVASTLKKFSNKRYN